MNSTHQVTSTTPQQVRAWMARRQAEKTAPPPPDQIRRDLDQIRRELGFGLIVANSAR